MSGIKKDANWARFSRATSRPVFQRGMEAALKKAILRVCLLLQDEIRGRIIKNEYGPITDLAVLSKSAKKKSSKALIDTGGLVQNITYKIIDPTTAFVGILRTARTAKRGGVSSGMTVFNLGRVLHDGVTIRVTDRMRDFFRAMASEYPGEWLPLRRSTTAIRIPARPFIKKPIEDRAVVRKISEEWARGLKEAFKV